MGYCCVCDADAMFLMGVQGLDVWPGASLSLPCNLMPVVITQVILNCTVQDKTYWRHSCLFISLLHEVKVKLQEKTLVGRLKRT
jgi:hypothetical protein